MKRDLAKDKRNPSAKSTLRLEDVAKLASLSRDVAMAAVSPTKKLAETARGVASYLATRGQRGIAAPPFQMMNIDPVGLSPKAARALRAAMDFEVAAPSAEPAAKKLNDHEMRILRVIQRGLRGRRYCQDLDIVGAKPPRSWREGGFPTSYLKAFDDADRTWRQMIQDEKSYIGRKAKAAGLLDSSKTVVASKIQ